MEKMKILWRKEYVRNLFQSALSFDMKKKLSKRLFRGKTAYIFAAAPSLNHVDVKRMENELSDNLVISIKQSVEVTKAYTDFMLINFCNLTDFDWQSITAPVFWTTFDDSHPSIIRENNFKCDETFKATGNGKNNADGFANSTAGAKRWSNLLEFEEGIIKWGPGLMYELALPLAIHFGVRKICLVAWDIGKLSDDKEAFVNEHFYDSSRIKNKMKINDTEIEVVSKSTESLLEWLKNENIELSVVSPSSLVSAKVKRENKWLKK